MSVEEELLDGAWALNTLTSKKVFRLLLSQKFWALMSILVVSGSAVERLAIQGLKCGLNANIWAHFGEEFGSNVPDRVYIHTYIHTYIRTYTHKHTHTYVHTFFLKLNHYNQQAGYNYKGDVVPVLIFENKVHMIHQSDIKVNHTHANDMSCMVNA